ncbi:MAG: DUF1804 family protein [Magnetococcales bacterium]|nr:DUF1804 family protein [Magnetococcales bacterium]
MKNNTYVEKIVDNTKKIASNETLRRAVRMAYRDNGGNLAKAAREHGVAEGTARRWRTVDRNQGTPWEVEPRTEPWDQAAGCLAGNRRERLVSALLEDYLGLHKEAMAAVKGGEVTPLERVEALSRLSQALDRTLRALGKASPELSRLAVARWVLERQAEFVRLRYPEHLGVLVEILEPFGAELVRETGMG